MSNTVAFKGFRPGGHVNIDGVSVGAWGGGEAALRNPLAINLDNHSYFSANQPFMNMIYGARFVSFGPPNYNADAMQPDPVTRLPRQVPDGRMTFDILWAAGDWGSNHPMLGERYVIRHNLDTLAPGQYSFTMAAGFTLVGTTRDALLVELADQNSNVFFSINTPPGGSMPAGWTIEMVRQSDLAAYENEALDALHPTRIFTPEYLEMLSRISPTGGKGPGLIRFMKASKSEEILYENSNQITRATDHYFASNGSIWPVEFMCALCNHLDAAPWITTPIAASEAMLTDMATRVATTLRADLQVWVECANEAWNAIYARVQRSCSGLAIEKFGTQGAQTGMVSIVEGSTTVTANGVDLTTVFGTGSNRAQHIVIEGFCYSVNTGSVTPSSMQLSGGDNGITRIRFALATATNASYLVPDKLASGTDALWIERGYTVKAARMAQIWAGVFTARNERARLKTQLGSQLANPNNASINLQASFWRGDGDFIEPSTVFDYVAVNTYFGSDLFTDAVKAEARTFLPGNQNGFNAFIESLVDGTNGSFSINRQWANIRSELSQFRALCDSYGVRLSAYEGGSHIAHRGRFRSDVDDADLIAAMQAFNYSANMERLQTTMCANAETYTDAPVMQHLGDVGPWGRGQFPLFPEYGAPDNGKLDALVAFADTNPDYY